MTLPAHAGAARARTASFKEQLRGIERQLDELQHRLEVGSCSSGLAGGLPHPL